MNTPELLFSVFIGIAAVQLLYWLLIFPRFSFKKPHETQRADLLPPVSVIVVGRNEAENFKKYLPTILHQDYPNFEVIAVNDMSSDDSIDVLEEMQKEHDHLRIVRVPENDHFWHGKKYGLALGIKAAQNEHLLLTDADCYPSSPDWIREMISGFMGGKEIVLGYGDVIKTKGVVNALSRFETVQTALQYFAWNFWGMPYMGVGRNLAYRKSLWFEQNGFIKHIHVPSGDDDLFVNSAAKRGKVGVVAKDTAHTLTESKETWKEWITQKRRHFSTSTLYKPHHKFVLATFAASIFWFWFFFAMALPFVDEFHMYIMLGVVGLRTIAQWVVGFTTSRFLGNADLVLLWPVYEMIWVLTGGYLLILNKVLGTSKKWK
ncbi:glycosyltransferase [Phaeocystidibacter marisrubri]|uniref:Glycosyltransferase n=1 Tax=Phaeocystidibacter marisrubri TaxID=1577780 RepID=A0A6L3ZH90_9FLAO|nr:glycosyltransferase [Phaeocystidibacter marisrubri]KAB2816989.1 glycosyltransferase [Phaeocystidibacter marisrubri]GGH77311.1 glycosyl transferase family 2 [Phaeocystidibacter marisrubri]